MKFEYLTRRELMEIMRALSTIPIMTACKGVTDASDTKDLTNTTSETSISQERINHVVQKFGIASWVQSGGQQQEAFKQLAAVPDVYLAFLQQRAQQVGFSIQFGGQAAGMCWFDNVGATKITLNDARFATIHEVGHGVETKAHQLQNQGDGASLRERTYSQVVSGAEASYIRPYAKSNSKELFADGFSSFYRSPQSRADMKSMPVTWQWLKSVLVCPVNLGPGENAADFIASPSDLATGTNNTNAANTTPGTTNTTLDNNVVQPGTTINGTNTTGSDPCAVPANELVAMICELSKAIGATGAGLALTEDSIQDEILLPNRDQFLTAHDRFLLMARLAITEQEASNVRLYLDKTLIKTGLEKDPYAGRSDVYSTMFKVPTEMTPSNDMEYITRNLSVTLGSKILISQPVRISRYSLCGDISDFKLQRR